MNATKRKKSLPFFHREGLANGLGFFIVVGGVNTFIRLYFDEIHTVGDWLSHLFWWALSGLLYGVAYNRWIYTL